MRNSGGKIVDKIGEAMEQYQKTNQSHSDIYKNSMNSAARKYTNLINEMRGQHITLYYDIVIREQK